MAKDITKCPEISRQKDQSSRVSDTPKNLVMLCDDFRIITGLINNAVDIEEKDCIGKDISCIITDDNIDKIELFLESIKSKKIVLNFEIFVKTTQGRCLLVFSGIKIDRSYLIIATNNDYILNELFDEMSRISNEQTNIIREIARDKVRIARLARERIERDLHDSVSQTIFSTRIIAEILPELWEKDREEAKRQLGKIKMLADDSLTEMRRILLELRPDAFAEEDIKDLLKQLVKSAKLRSNIDIRLNVQGDSRLEPKLKEVIYRIAQEATNNAIKHSEADSVRLDLKFLPEKVELKVKDDGVGFDINKVPKNKYGLYIMKDRARSVGSSIVISSMPDKGTSVDFEYKY